MIISQKLSSLFLKKVIKFNFSEKRGHPINWNGRSMLAPLSLWMLTIVVSCMGWGLCINFMGTFFLVNLSISYKETCAWIWSLLFSLLSMFAFVIISCTNYPAFQLVEATFLTLHTLLRWTVLVVRYWEVVNVNCSSEVHLYICFHLRWLLMLTDLDAYMLLSCFFILFPWAESYTCFFCDSVLENIVKELLFQRLIKKTWPLNQACDLSDNKLFLPPSYEYNMAYIYAGEKWKREKKRHNEKQRLMYLLCSALLSLLQNRFSQTVKNQFSHVVGRPACVKRSVKIIIFSYR